ncbi:MAG: glycoside hydrolase family 19 protein [Methylomarinum sp.]|nr:glycoside hydrolase family 19 protein [Methylomarinum sp.]
MILRKGSRGNNVKKIQTLLGVTATGYFGSETDKKVRQWQQQQGLVVDGIVGDKTWVKLFPAAAIAATINALTLPLSDINLDKLRGHVPDDVIAQIPEAAAKFNITNSLRLAHFLSQCAHESGEFKFLRENLNYSENALTRVFSRYFPETLAQFYARQPEKIGSRVYANRLGNGDEASGEGYKFRGRGYIQLTGKANYQKFADFIDQDLLANPDLVATQAPLLSAAFFFASNHLWQICDRGSSDVVVTALSKRVNGGKNGLADRQQKFKEYYALLCA